jgi:hypothetical protein
VARTPKRDALAGERKRRSVEEGSRRDLGRTPVATTRRDAATTCGWCHGPIDIKPTGRIPKWCSPACRQRAWEQSRAAESGRAAVEVVERVVEVKVVGERAPRRDEWPALLRELHAQLEDGRIRARDLPDLGAALTNLIAAYNRRQNPRRIRR